ncbi:OsmC family protein [Kitasatospora sp. NPDC050467]|uniref:OsmC family protein n=1 Tax=unclassified Kitasatospora TaxID=2633591 RepID=UPI00324BB52E
MGTASAPARRRPTESEGEPAMSQNPTSSTVSAAVDGSTAPGATQDDAQAAAPEFRRVTTALVTGTSADAPFHVDVKAGTHPLTSDEPVRRGGSDSGPEPFALLLASLGSCTAITLRMYAERKEWPLESVRVRLGYETDGRNGRITRRVALSGALDDTQRTRLLDICERTPVTLALRAGVAIDTTEDHA